MAKRKQNDIFTHEELLEPFTFRKYLDTNIDEVKSLNKTSEDSSDEEDETVFHSKERSEILHTLKKRKITEELSEKTNKIIIKDDECTEITEQLSDIKIKEQYFDIFVFYETIHEHNKEALDKISIVSLNLFLPKNDEIDFKKKPTKYKNLDSSWVNKTIEIKYKQFNIKMIILNKRVKFKSTKNEWKEYLCSFENKYENNFKNIYEDTFGINSFLFKKEFIINDIDKNKNKLKLLNLVIEKLSI